MSEAFIESLYAKCHRCGNKLTSDEGGCPTCRVCEDEFERKHPDSLFDAIQEYVEEVALKLYDTDSPIFVKDWRERISLAVGNELGGIDNGRKET